MQDTDETDHAADAEIGANLKDFLLAAGKSANAATAAPHS